MVQTAGEVSYFLEVGNSRTFKWVEELFEKATKRLPKWEKVRELRTKLARCGQEIVVMVENAIRRGINLNYKIRVWVGNHYETISSSHELAQTINPRRFKRFQPRSDRQIRHLPRMSQASFRSR